MIEGLKPYPEYKESGSKWLGTVPETWRVRNLRTLITKRNERNRTDLPLLSVAREKGVFVRLLGDDDDNHNFIPEDLSKYKVANAGSLVINKMKAWQGSMGIAPCDGIVSPAYFVFDFAIENRAFGQRLLRSKPYVAHFAAASDGVRVGQWDLSIAGMREIPVLMPPPDEQLAIVRFLDHANRKIDGFIRAKRKLIGLLNEQKQAIIHRAVTRGLDPNAKLKPSGIPWLGEIPENWETRRLRFCIKGKLAYGANEAAEFDNPDWPRYLRITDFRSDGTLKSDTFRSLPPHIAKDYPVQDGDILFARSGATVGKAFLVRTDTATACYAGYLIRARPRADIVLPEFLFAYTQSLAFAQWKDEIFSKATIQNIGADKYSNLVIPIPGIGEQQRILAHIGSESSPLNTAIARTEREIALMQEYRTRLTADIVTGKLDVREAAAKLPEVAVGDANDIEDPPEESEDGEGGDG